MQSKRSLQQDQLPGPSHSSWAGIKGTLIMFNELWFQLWQGAGSLCWVTQFQVLGVPPGQDMSCPRQESWLWLRDQH